MKFRKLNKWATDVWRDSLNQLKSVFPHVNLKKKGPSRRAFCYKVYRLKSVAENIISNIPLIVACFALYITIVQLQDTRRHNEILTTPAMGLMLSEDGIYLKNCGFGIAIITDITITIGNKKYSVKSPYYRGEVLEALKLRKSILRLFTVGSDTMNIGPQESVEFIVPSEKRKTLKEMKSLYTLLQNIEEIEVEYTSIYGKLKNGRPRNHITITLIWPILRDKLVSNIR